MRCPFCGNEDTSVLETRETTSGSTRRRRVCQECEKRFTTYENPESTPLIIVKKSGVREAYDRNKIKAGILRACEKRPVALEEIDQVVDEIENELRSQPKEEVSSKKVGSLIMRKLKKLDKVAYIRFASVYREFADVDSFEEEIKKLLKKR